MLTLLLNMCFSALLKRNLIIHLLKTENTVSYFIVAGTPLSFHT